MREELPAKTTREKLSGRSRGGEVKLVIEIIRQVKRQVTGKGKVVGMRSPKPVTK